MKRCLIETALALFLLVYAADLLYLYFNGHWYDPVRLIELAEVVILVMTIPACLIYVIWRVRKELR